MLTEDQIDKYLFDGGMFCPKCRSENIMGVPGFDLHSDCISQTVVCSSCGFIWTDIYTLDRIEEE